MINAKNKTQRQKQQQTKTTAIQQCHINLDKDKKRKQKQNDNKWWAEQQQSCKDAVRLLAKREENARERDSVQLQ